MSLAVFYYRPMQHGTDEQGIPFYKNEVFVKISRDITNTVDRRIKESDKDRFPAQWRFFEKQDQTPEHVEGLFVEMWAPAKPDDVMNLKGHGIFTVQQLAKVSGKGTPSHILDLVSKAKNYLKLNEGTAKLFEEVEQLRTENGQLKEINVELRASAKAAELAVKSKEKS